MARMYEDKIPLGGLDLAAIKKIRVGESLWFVYPRETTYGIDNKNPYKIEVRLKKSVTMSSDEYIRVVLSSDFNWICHQNNGGFYWSGSPGWLFYNFWHAYAYWLKIK